MFDKSAIQQVTQSEATSASNLALQHSLTAGEPLAIFHDDFKTVDLEQYLHQRRRARNSFNTPYVADFSRYVGQHREHGCSIYVNAEEMAAKAVLNQGGADRPGHGDNTAVVKLRKTAPYAALGVLTGRHRSQKELGEWLEEWRHLVKPLGKESEELNIAHVVAGVRSVSIEQINNSTTNVEALSAERSELESVSAKTNRTDAVLPAYLMMEIQPYKELQARKFYARVSIITSERAPTFSLAILGQEIHDEEMAEEFAHVVRHSFAADESQPAAPDVLIGSFSVNR